MHPLERHVLRTLRTRQLVRPGEPGLLSVSGGPDSMALLRLMLALREVLAMELEGVHFDHGLRPESARDAQWVAEQTAKWGLVCHIRRAEHLQGRSTGIQAAAREWRRTEGERLLQERKLAWMATGHQRDDQMETWLLKWLRGAHLSHLGGMSWRRGPLVRPLLDTSRSTLVDYLKDKGQDWLEDPSNRSLQYKRNRVRHELLPLLDRLTEGGIIRRLTDLETQSRALANWLEAERVMRPAPDINDPKHPPHWLAVAPLAALPTLLREEALHRFIQQRLPGALEYHHLAQASQLLEGHKSAWSLDLPAGRVLKRRGERLLLEKRDPDPLPPRRYVVEGRHITVPAGWRLQSAADPATRSAEAGVAATGLEALVLHNLPLEAHLVVRPRQPGDRFQPPWKRGPILLKDFLRDEGMPLWQREHLPVVEWEHRIIAVHPRFVAKGHEAPEAMGQAPGSPSAAGPPLRLILFMG